MPLFRRAWTWAKQWGRRDARQDGLAGLVLGVESVPDGLASGLLAGVNPVAGLYAYLYGMAGGACFNGTSLMAVQGTGAMALIVADAELASHSDPERALFTLSILTGAVMIAAGVLRGGVLIRFVPTSLMVGFISAIGLNIVFGQLDTLSGYESEGDSRIAHAFDLLFHFWEVDLDTLAVGVLAIVLIVGLQRTRAGALGMVVAIAVASMAASLIGSDAPRVSDIAAIPEGLPRPTLPVLREVPSLVVPALSLAFVGLVQGAGVSAAVSTAPVTPQRTSRDFIGQGAGNVVSGVFRGMPVGGSMSASVLVVAGGARTRMAMIVAGVVMAMVMVLFADLVSKVSMPALAGLLVVIGVGTIKPAQIMAVLKTGNVQIVVMSLTFVLTLVIPVQFAVLAGVALAVLLYVVRQSNSITLRALEIDDAGRAKEVDPPAQLPSGTVVVLQPYGSLFFASAPSLQKQLPEVTEASVNSVAILRLRGVDELGVTQIGVVRGYGESLTSVGSKLVVVASSDRLLRQIRRSGLADELGRGNIYRGNAWIGETVIRAHRDAQAWVAERTGGSQGSESREPKRL